MIILDTWHHISDQITSGVTVRVRWGWCTTATGKGTPLVNQSFIPAWNKCTMTLMVSTQIVYPMMLPQSDCVVSIYLYMNLRVPLSLNRSFARHGGLWLQCMQYNLKHTMFFMTVIMYTYVYWFTLSKKDSLVCFYVKTKFCVAKQLSWLCKYTRSHFTVSQTSLVLGVLFYATTKWKFTL